MGLQGAAPRPPVGKALGLIDRQTKPIRRHAGPPPIKAQVIHFINKPMPGGLPKRTSRALLDIEDRRRAGDPRSETGSEDSGRRVLLPRLRLGAAVLAGRPGHAGHALRRRRADRAAAGLPVLRLSADRGRRGREGPADHHRQPRAVPPRRQHAELPRHQDGDRVLRHLHGSAAEVRIRQDLPRLPAARHPRIPDGEGREARGRHRRALHVSRPLPHADEDACAA
jgi:hypothetical protein